jgi:hypothetical protein
MSVRVVNVSEIRRRAPRGSRFSQVFEQWFSQVLALKENEALEITVDRKANPKLPSEPTVRSTVKKWNEEHSDKQITLVGNSTNTDRPIYYLYLEGKGKPVRQKFRKV